MNKENIMDFIGVASAMILMVVLMYLVMIITR